MESSGGLVRVGWGEFDANDYAPPLGWQGSFWPFEGESDTYFVDLRPATALGFGYEHWVQRAPGLAADTHLVTFPYWLPALVCAALPLTIVTRRIHARRRKRNAGVCPACG